MPIKTYTRWTSRIIIITDEALAREIDALAILLNVPAQHVIEAVLMVNRHHVIDTIDDILHNPEAFGLGGGDK